MPFRRLQWCFATPICFAVLFYAQHARAQQADGRVNDAAVGQPSKPDKPNETDQSSETNKPKQPASSPLTIGTDLRVQDYRPKSQLVVPATNLRHAKFPV
ncbi:MAG: hypothetical protein AAFP90_03830, partial [Planctomycetota bacterium]